MASKKLKVLSLFDGLSGARLALENSWQSGIEVEEYYSFEVDKFANKISRKNFPDIQQMGSVVDYDFTQLKGVDLLIGGPPCQDLSIGNATGKGLEGEKSGLFYHFIRALKEAAPKYFIMENVASMKEKDRNIISKLFNFEPVEINSAVFTAQQRKRLYWTNIQVDRKEIDSMFWCDTELIDVLEENPGEKYKIPDGSFEYMSRKVKGGRDHWDFGHHSSTADDKSKAIIANLHKGVPYNVLIDWLNNDIRKFMPVECERLQGIPDDYTAGVSDTQRYKMIGNGFTIPVITYLLRNIHLDPAEEKQFLLFG